MHPQRCQQLLLDFPGLSPIEQAVQQRADSGVEQRGAVFTKREVVEFILDLVGYTADKYLHQMRLLEPALGDGDFLVPIVERLFTAFQARAGNMNPALVLKDAIRGVELHRKTFEGTHARLIELLRDKGLSAAEARTLAHTWLRQGDFLLTEHEPLYTHVIGNPPYVRQELIPDVLMEEYRRRYATIFDRADIYIPFIEHGLSLLGPNGKLGFICADRWMKNRYGQPLRRMVASKFRLETFVDMFDTPAFHAEVVAYPAIFVISNTAPGPTRIAHRPPIEALALQELAKALTNPKLIKRAAVTEVDRVTQGIEPWLFDSSDQLDVVRRIERDFPLIEDAGCQIGIGVATGNDRVFVGRYDELDVEDDRKLPLAMSRDIVSGTVQWRGFGVINPFGDEGKLVALMDYPRFARFIERHSEEIRRRHISQKNPASWYRTIDRIYPSLTTKPKLLIPDIKGDANIVFEQGRLYPHHNLYFITSDSWDLQALQAVLLSGIARLFVATYTTKMRGGYLRFQAQYLRRIRLPLWRDVSPTLQKELREAAHSGGRDACNEAMFRLFNLTSAERQVVAASKG